MDHTPDIHFRACSLNSCPTSTGHNPLICEILYAEYCKHMGKHCIHCMQMTLLTF